MMYLQDGLYVSIKEDKVPTAPLPKPLQNGFSRRFAYLALGAFSLAESGEAFFILANDRDEIWFISNRHLRVHQLLPGSRDFRRPVGEPPPATAKAASLGKNGARPQRPKLAKRRAKVRV